MAQQRPVEREESQDGYEKELAYYERELDVQHQFEDT
jgi:hypothetical protein